MPMPSKYKAGHGKAMVEYFDRPPWVEVERVNPKTGAEYTERVPSTLPTFEGFAGSLGVTHATLLNWRKEYPEFAEAYARCKEIQKDILVQNGLNRLYDARFTMFMACNNTDLRQEKHVKQEVRIGEIEDDLATGLSDEDLARIVGE